MANDDAAISNAAQRVDILFILSGIVDNSFALLSEGLSPFTIVQRYNF